MTSPAPGDPAMRRDLASAYLASASRIGSWVIVSALVYRYAGAEAFGMLALVRGTIGLLNYTTLGLSPALIHESSKLRSHAESMPPTEEIRPGDVLSYEPPPQLRITASQLFSNAMAITTFSGIIGIILCVSYAAGFYRLYRIPPSLLNTIGLVVALMGTGSVMRLVSDAPGAILQVRRRIALDNMIVAAGDLSWAALSVLLLVARRADIQLLVVALMYFLSGIGTLACRVSTSKVQSSFNWALIHVPTIASLLGYGLIVVLAQLADYLYAPTDYILINRLLLPADLANYAPAVQIDAGLLVLVAGLSSVLLPKAALAHAAGSTQTVRRYYLRGTLASLSMLTAGSAAVWLVSPWLFRLWLGNSMPGTRAILPLVLAHTIIGGSSAVGRSILVAIRKAKPFAIAVLIAGVTNVACSFAFVKYLHMGVNGIVLGTIVAVVARCAIWMPWYVLRVTSSHYRP